MKVRGKCPNCGTKMETTINLPPPEVEIPIVVKIDQLDNLKIMIVEFRESAHGCRSN